MSDYHLWEEFKKLNKKEITSVAEFKNIKIDVDFWSEKNLSLYRGSMLQVFQPIFGTIVFEKPISQVECAKYEQVIIKDIEKGIRHKGSSINVQVQFYSTPGLKNALDAQLNFFEDKASGRLLQEDEIKRAVENNVRKNIPQDYKIEAISYALNTFNPESVVTKVMTQESFKLNYLTESALAQHYCVHCKIYPFPNKVCSVRIIISRIYIDNAA